MIRASQNANRNAPHNATSPWSTVPMVLERPPRSMVQQPLVSWFCRDSGRLSERKLRHSNRTTDSLYCKEKQIANRRGLTQPVVGFVAAIASNQHFSPAAAAFVRTHIPVSLHTLDELSCAMVADLKPALQPRGADVVLPLYQLQRRDRKAHPDRPSRPAGRSRESAAHWQPAARVA